MGRAHPFPDILMDILRYVACFDSLVVSCRLICNMSINVNDVRRTLMQCYARIGSKMYKKRPAD
jgi:hypothetical protein